MRVMWSKMTLITLSCPQTSLWYPVWICLPRLNDLLLWTRRTADNVLKKGEHRFTCALAKPWKFSSVCWNSCWQQVLRWPITGKQNWIPCPPLRATYQVKLTALCWTVRTWTSQSRYIHIVWYTPGCTEDLWCTPGFPVGLPTVQPYSVLCSLCIEQWCSSNFFCMSYLI